MKRRWTVMLEVALLLALIVWVVVTMAGRAGNDRVSVKVRLRGTSESASLVENPDGGYHYEITRNNGQKRTLTPDELAELTFRDQHKLTWWMRLLNITGRFELLYVTIGLLGQVLFTGRMLVQWLASEREKRSVVPPVFWWMSLIGASMLVIYFIWRHDPVGILGQAVGWFVYVRNLWLIYRPHGVAVVPVTQDPAPEPELSE